MATKHAKHTQTEEPALTASEQMVGTVEPRTNPPSAYDNFQSNVDTLTAAIKSVFTQNRFAIPGDTEVWVRNSVLSAPRDTYPPEQHTNKHPF